MQASVQETVEGGTTATSELLRDADTVGGSSLKLQKARRIFRELRSAAALMDDVQ